MSRAEFIRSNGGRQFHFGGDTFTIKRSPRETADGSSLTHLIVAPETRAPCHDHERYEETFYILDGELEFTLGEETFTVRAGDYICAPPKTRHGYVNKSGKPVSMLFTFSPGGMEELFYDFRDELGPTDWKRYGERAKREHGTVYESE